MATCNLCGEVIKKNDEFILGGKFPSVFKRAVNFDLYNMRYYGDLYHKSCYVQKIKTGI